MVISRSTTNVKSTREMLLRRYWSDRRQTCLTDALGFDELLQLVADRRLEKITVEHVERTTSYRRSNQEWASLHKLISDLAGGIKLEDYSDGRYQPPKHRAGAAADDDDVGKF